MRERERVESVRGHAEVRQISTANKTPTAGCMVSDGVIRRGAQARLIRATEPVWEGTIGTLRRVKDDVREVAAGLGGGTVPRGAHAGLVVGPLAPLPGPPKPGCARCPGWRY